MLKILPDNGARNFFMRLEATSVFPQRGRDDAAEQRKYFPQFLTTKVSIQQEAPQKSLVPTQTNKNLATNAIKGLSIPSRPLAKVRSDRDNNKINIFGIFMIQIGK